MTNINTFQGDVFIHEYIKHTGDDNNLFGFSGTDTFKIATAGDDRLTINASGLVGIGVAAGGELNKLHVHVGTQAYSGIHLSTTNTGFAKLIGNAQDGGHNSIVKTGDTGIVFSPDDTPFTDDTGKGFYIAPWANTTSGLKILDNGNVGIGKAVPAYALDVVGDIRGGCPVFFQRSSGVNTGTGSTINFNRSIYSKGGGWNISTDKFYAPVAGYYHLAFSCMSNFNQGVHAYRFRLNGSDHPYSTQDARVYGYIGSAIQTYMRICGQTIMYIGLGQYAEILNEPDTSSIHESYNQFTGFLLGT
jgi:hypothetical protein